MLHIIIVEHDNYSCYFAIFMSGIRAALGRSYVRHTCCWLFLVILSMALLSAYFGDALAGDSIASWLQKEPLLHPGTPAGDVDYSTDPYRMDNTERAVLVIVQVSDTHVNTNSPDITDDLKELFTDTVPHIAPEFVIISGDITDGVQQRYV